MSQYKIDAEVVLRLANGRWDEILSNLAPALRPAIDAAPRHCECPLHGGSDGFRFFRDFKKTGPSLSKYFLIVNQEGMETDTGSVNGSSEVISLASSSSSFLS